MTGDDPAGGGRADGPNEPEGSAGPGGPHGPEGSAGPGGPNGPEGSAGPGGPGSGSPAAGAPPEHDPATANRPSPAGGEWVPAGAPERGRRASQPGLVDLLRLLWDHVGRIAAVFLGMAFLLGLLFLAVIGSSSALVLLVVLIVGAAMIIVGARMRPGQRRR